MSYSFWFWLGLQQVRFLDSKIRPYATRSSLASCTCRTTVTVKFENELPDGHAAHLAKVRQRCHVGALTTTFRGPAVARWMPIATPTSTS